MYETFEERVFSVVDGVKVKVQKTQIVFFNWHNFAFVSILLVRNAKRLWAVCASKLEYAGGRAAGNMEHEVYFTGKEKIYQMDFSKVYHLLINKAERKGRTR